MIRDVSTKIGPLGNALRTQCASSVTEWRLWSRYNTVYNGYITYIQQLILQIITYPNFSLEF